MNYNVVIPYYIEMWFTLRPRVNIIIKHICIITSQCPSHTVLRCCIVQCNGVWGVLSLGLATTPSVLQVCQLSIHTVLVLFYCDNVTGGIVFLSRDNGSLIVGSHLGVPRHWVVCWWIRCRWVGRVESVQSVFLHYFAVLLIAINLRVW